MNNKCLKFFPMAALVLALGGCFDLGNGDGSSGGAGGAPTLAFNAPQSTYDLANYYETGRYSLPIGSGNNLLASEASGVTYNQATGTLFVVGDEGTAIVQVSKQGSLIDSMTLTGFEDTEGVSWINGNTFALVEERLRQVNRISYIPNINLDASTVQHVKLGTTIDNIGLEGLSYDPKTSGYILVKEISPSGVFQTGIDFAAGTASNGSPATVNSANLFDPTLTGLSAHNDVFALSNILQSSAPDYDNIVIISAPDGQVVKLDRDGNIQSTLTVGSAAQDEGVTMDPSGNLYAVGEKGGGDGHPEMVVFTPTRDKSAVGTGSNLYLTFSQDMIAGVGNIVLSNGAGDVRNIPVGDTQVTIDGKVVKINPAVDLSPGSKYHITYDAGVFKQASGADAGGVSSSTALSFTTVGQADATAPQLFSTTPSSDATDVVASAPVALNFNEAMQAGTGNITLSSSTDTRSIPVTDTNQVRFSGQSVLITPTTPLQGAATYSVQLDAGVLQDAAGNAYAGIMSPTAFRFTTASVSSVVTTLLITEVNTNATGGDFFELYNYGSDPADLSGWKWGDSEAVFATDAIQFPAGTTIPAGGRLVVTNAPDLAAFKTDWNLSGSVAVVDTGTEPGLGKGDAVVVYDPSGNWVTAFNYTPAALLAAGPTVATVMGSSGVTVTLSPTGHAGAVLGGTATTSAVWDGLSTSAPTYKAASVGDALNSYAQSGDAASIGSPGQ